MDGTQVMRSQWKKGDGYPQWQLPQSQEPGLLNKCSLKAVQSTFMCAECRCHDQSQFNLAEWPVSAVTGYGTRTTPTALLPANHWKFPNSHKINGLHMLKWHLS